MKYQIGDRVTWTRDSGIWTVVDVYEFNLKITFAGETRIALKAQCRKVEESK